MGFALQSNPFFGLSASPRDGRERLADLAEEAVEQGRLTRPEAQALLRALTASRPRLEAELGWLPGIAPATARRAAERAVAHDLAGALGLLGDAPSIGRLNIAAHVCAAGRIAAFQRWVETICAGIDPHQLAATIGADRAVAGFPAPPAGEIAAGLEALTARHAAAVAETLGAAPRGGATLAAAIRAAADRPPVPPALDGVLERWDAARLGEVEGLAEALEQAAAQLSAAPRDWSALATIRALLARASAATAPRRAREAAAGMDAPAARRIAAKVRALAHSLAERHHAAGAAYALSAALLDAFPDLPEFSAWLRADLRALEPAGAPESDQNVLRLLTQALEAARQAPAELAVRIAAGELRRGRQDAGRAALRGLRRGGIGQRQAPWRSQRALADAARPCPRNARRARTHRCGAGVGPAAGLAPGTGRRLAANSGCRRRAVGASL